MSEKGWSQRAAAKHLGYSFQHFNLVLCGHRTSARLLAAVEAIEARKVEPKKDAAR